MADNYPTNAPQLGLQRAKRNRELAAALMQNSLSPTQGGMVGRYYVGEGIGSGLARLGQALLARKLNEGADSTEQGAIAAKQASDAQAMQDFMGSVTPQEISRTVPTGLDNMVEATTLKQIKKPSSRDIGLAILNYQNKTGQQVPEGMVKLLSPEPLKVGQGETLLNPTDNSVMYNNPKTPDGMMAGPDGKMSWIPGYIGGKVQIAQAGRPTTNVNVNNAKYTSALQEAQGKSDAELLDQLRNGARAATQAMNTLNTLEGLSDKVFSGAGANTKLGLEKWFGSLGIPMSQQAINSESFNSIAGDLVLKQIKMLGANPTDSDRRFIEELVPQLESNPAARVKLIRYLKDKAGATIKDYQDATAYAQKNGSLSGYIGGAMQAPSGNDFDL